MSRLLAKGIRKDTLELIESVLTDYHLTRTSLSDIAQINKVSPGVVSKIVNGKYYVKIKTFLVAPRSIRFYWEEETNSIKRNMYDAIRTMAEIRRHWVIA